MNSVGRPIYARTASACQARCRHGHHRLNPEDLRPRKQAGCRPGRGGLGGIRPRHCPTQPLPRPALKLPRGLSRCRDAYLAAHTSEPMMTVIGSLASATARPQRSEDSQADGCLRPAPEGFGRIVAPVAPRKPSERRSLRWRVQSWARRYHARRAEVPLWPDHLGNPSSMSSTLAT